MSENLDVKLTIDETKMRELVNKAILDQLTDDAKERIIADAIEHLNTVPSASMYGRGGGESPLQTAFNAAVGQEAFKLAREYVANDHRFRQRFQELLTAVAKKALEDDVNLKNAATHAMVSALMDDK